MLNIISETYRYTHRHQPPHQDLLNDVSQLALMVFCLNFEWLSEKVSEWGHIKNLFNKALALVQKISFRFKELKKSKR